MAATMPPKGDPRGFVRTWVYPQDSNLKSLEKSNLYGENENLPVDVQTNLHDSI